MPIFQILYLSENVLDHSEEIEFSDLLEAIDRAMTKAPGLTAEIRRDGGRVGLVGPSFKADVARSIDHNGEATNQRQESEIAEEMKIRLQLVR